jgi:hypothetical protein
MLTSLVIFIVKLPYRLGIGIYKIGKFLFVPNNKKSHKSKKKQTIKHVKR